MDHIISGIFLGITGYQMLSMNPSIDYIYIYIFGGFLKYGVKNPAHRFRMVETRKKWDQHGSTNYQLVQDFAGPSTVAMENHHLQSL